MMAEHRLRRATPAELSSIHAGTRPPLRATHFLRNRCQDAVLAAVLGLLLTAPRALGQDPQTPPSGGAQPTPTQQPAPQPLPGTTPQPPPSTTPRTQGPGGATQEPQGKPRMVVDEATNTISFSMNESQGMELVEFVKWAQEVTGKAFTFNVQDLQGANAAPISFLGTLRIKRDRFKEDFFSFFQTMLYIRNFALVPRGEGDLEVLEILSMAGPRAREVTNGARYVTPDELHLYRSQTGVPILTTVTLKHINAPIATNSLRPFFAQTGSAGGPGGTPTLGNVGNNTAMLVQGFGPQVYAAVELLKLVDVPTDEPNLVVQVVPLDQQAPEELEPILTEVLESRQKIRNAVLAEGGAQPGAAPGTSTQPQLKIVVHSSQKALVLSGTQEQVRDALGLIARLDVPSEPIDGQANVIHLKNVLAEDLRKTLHDFVADDSAAENAVATPGGAGAATARRTRKTVINAHKESNSLLISAAGTKWRQIQELIDELDRRQPQVLIEAALVELSTGDLDRFGVELGLLDIKNSGNFTRGFGFSHFGQSKFQDTDDDGLPDTRLPDFDNPLQGLTGGILSGGDFAVPLLLNALSTDDKANILSLPSVLVNNNEEAIVKTEEERPTTQSNQSNSSTTQSNGPPRNAGITLEISPTISPNNYLRLNINLEVSRFEGAFDPNSATGGGIVRRRTIKTQVTMPSDATMVLGGVIEDSESSNDGGIPLLKDIPILGFFFRKSEATTTKTNLYFFVTPTILDEDDFQDLWHVSLNKKLEAQDYIGERRLQLIDRRWDPKSAKARRLEDPGTTVEDLDRYGAWDTPTFSRNTGPTAPGSPEQKNGTKPR